MRGQHQEATHFGVAARPPERRHHAMIHLAHQRQEGERLQLDVFAVQKQKAQMKTWTVGVAAAGWQHAEAQMLRPAGDETRQPLPPSRGGCWSAAAPPPPPLPPNRGSS